MVVGSVMVGDLTTVDTAFCWGGLVEVGFCRGGLVGLLFFTGGGMVIMRPGGWKG